FFGTFGCSSAQADAAKISAKPMMSVVVGISPSSGMEETTPITGDARAPSEAVVAGSRRMMWNQRKYARPDPKNPLNAAPESDHQPASHSRNELSRNGTKAA